MLCEILIRRVDIRFVPARVSDASLEVIGDQDLRDAPEELKGMDMRYDPGRQFL